MSRAKDLDLHGRRQMGKYDFTAPKAPVEDDARKTFTVSIFRWTYRISKEGLKKGGVVYRVIGGADDYDLVCRRAEEVCYFLDCGGVLTKKTERVKPEVSDELPP